MLTISSPCLMQFASASSTAAQVSYTTMQDNWFAFLRELQTYVDTQWNPLPVLSSPPPPNDENILKDVWSVIQELRVTTCQQAAQEAQAPLQPTLDP
ncbi:hypothetical protein DSO57_1017978 [Entomophthora muscae]|uniref:Uncharacterized protein n=1 Tax=Entomophthora muscae TaxID=34485 RepID=A0ACC2T4V0_9FUNG|nr:hypothetical protein DSO57_1017978 [Entomophthora muscae]